MRKIKYILDNEKELKGQHSALMNCADKSTISRYKKAIELMDSCNIATFKHIQPLHAVQIVRHVNKKDWPQWITLPKKSLRLSLSQKNSHPLSVRNATWKPLLKSISKHSQTLNPFVCVANHLRHGS